MKRVGEDSHRRPAARGRAVARASFAVVMLLGLAHCKTDPPKGEALRVIQRDLKPQGLCTISADILASFKTQYRTKATCLPLTGTPPRASECLDAMVKAGVTRDMPASYMVEWPDEVATAGLDLIPAYDRKARNLIFKRCVAASDELRVGSIECARAEYAKVSKVTTDDPEHATVRVDRELSMRADIADLEKACGPLVRPSVVEIVKMVKRDGAWFVDKPEGG
ncbi:MAG: hypothetical protein KC657_15665 [Myxococcales bacterium]|nr:hypothetical protein [Myxococcales bacterium]